MFVVDGVYRRGIRVDVGHFRSFAGVDEVHIRVYLQVEGLLFVVVGEVVAFDDAEVQKVFVSLVASQFYEYPHFGFKGLRAEGVEFGGCCVLSCFADMVGKQDEAVVSAGGVGKEVEEIADIIALGDVLLADVSECVYDDQIDRGFGKACFHFFDYAITGEDKSHPFGFLTAQLPCLVLSFEQLAHGTAVVLGGDVKYLLAKGKAFPVEEIPIACHTGGELSQQSAFAAVAAADDCSHAALRKERLYQYGLFLYGVFQQFPHIGDLYEI